MDEICKGKGGEQIYERIPGDEDFPVDEQAVNGGIINIGEVPESNIGL